MTASKKSVMKFLVFVVVMLLTHLAISGLKREKLLAQILNGRKSVTQDRVIQNQVAPGLKTERVGQNNLNILNDVQQQLPTTGLVASSKLVGAVIDNNGNVVSINANVYLYDSDLTRRYMWSVRVINKNTNQEISHRHYVEQMFTVLPDGHRDVRFEDRIEVLPGFVRVELVLYKIKPSFDFDKLSDLNFAKTHSVVRYGKAINIAPY